MKSNSPSPDLKRPVVVLKFGGTSLSDSERIRRACEVAADRHRSGLATVVVVSAQAAITDRLLEQARELAPQPHLRELDLLLSSGERISAALFAICLNSMGVEAIGLTGSQAGIITDNRHTRAQIAELRPYRIAEALQAGRVVVVGGFQGVSNQKEITTLGRGGSDITAVALAAALNAEVCEIFSDVDGVYSADPRVVEKPFKLDRIPISDMEVLARSGAKVLHPDAVALARRGRVRLHARTSFDPHASGTIIDDFDVRPRHGFLGIASIRGLHWLRSPSRLDGLLAELESRSIHPTLIWGSEEGKEWNILVAERDNPPLSPLLSELRCRSSDFEIRSQLCLVTLVGSEGVDAMTMVQASRELVRIGAPPLHLDSAPGKFRFLTEDRYHDRVVSTLHDNLPGGHSPLA